jgi:DtxR family transcriptional regulator, Mn-dependent transcriptional regulator
MLNYSISEENYIKTIFHLQQHHDTVTTNALAKELKTSAASVTDMMKKLKIKKLLHYEAYRGFKLSTEGRKVALGIIRRHRLWEFFLAEKLKFNWEEVHAVAEELEHVGSKKLIDKLDEYLGHPKFDPHGDPIPDINGKIESNKQFCITALPLSTSAVVCRVQNQSVEMLDLLKHKKITIGTNLEIKKKFSYDESLEVKIKQQPAFTISNELAKNIFVKYEE